MAMKMNGPLSALSEEQPERCSVAGAMGVLGTKSAMFCVRVQALTNAGAEFGPENLLVQFNRQTAGESVR